MLATKGKSATVALVSHGNFLEQQPLASCWPHPKNTQIYEALLPERPGGKQTAQLESVRVLYGGG